MRSRVKTSDSIARVGVGSEVPYPSKLDSWRRRAWAPGGEAATTAQEHLKHLHVRGAATGSIRFITCDQKLGRVCMALWLLRRSDVNLRRSSCMPGDRGSCQPLPVPPAGHLRADSACAGLQFLNPKAVRVPALSR